MTGFESLVDFPGLHCAIGFGLEINLIVEMALHEELCVGYVVMDRSAAGTCNRADCYHTYANVIQAYCASPMDRRYALLTAVIGGSLVVREQVGICLGIVCPVCVPHE